MCSGGIPASVFAVTVNGTNRHHCTAHATSTVSRPDTGVPATRVAHHRPGPPVASRHANSPARKYPEASRAGVGGGVSQRASLPVTEHGSKTPEQPARVQSPPPSTIRGLEVSPIRQPALASGEILNTGVQITRQHLRQYGNGRLTPDADRAVTENTGSRAFNAMAAINPAGNATVTTSRAGTEILTALTISPDPESIDPPDTVAYRFIPAVAVPAQILHEVSLLQAKLLQKRRKQIISLTAESQITGPRGRIFRHWSTSSISAGTGREIDLDRVKSTLHRGRS